MGKIREMLSSRTVILAALAVLMLVAVAVAGAHFGKRPVVAADDPNGPTKQVLVYFKDATVVTSNASAGAQREAIAEVNSQVFDQLPYSVGFKQKVRDYGNLPVAAYVVDADGEASLRADPNVLSVTDDDLIAPGTYEAVPTIGGSTTTGFSDGTMNFTGNGYTVAVLDTGVNAAHPLFAGKTILEACFNTNYTGSYTAVSRCPAAAATATGAGSAADCDSSSWDGCAHGSNVSSIAVGSTTASTAFGGMTLGGVAKDADLVAINVFSRFTGVSICGSSDPCLRSFTSDQFAAIDYIIDLITGSGLPGPLASVNMSLGGGPYHNDQSACNAESYITTMNSVAATLKGYGVATVVANGNAGDISGNENKIGQPACASNVVAVGSTNKAGTTIASYSNNGPLTDLLAPGADSEDSSSGYMVGADGTGTSPNTDLTGMAGTSQATPMVAGAFAVLREKHPNATVDQLTALLQSSGIDVNDARSGYTVGAKKRIRLAQALQDSPYPVITDFEGPVGTVNEGESIQLTGSVQNTTSCSVNNGVGGVQIVAGGFGVNVPGAASYTLTCLNAYGDSVSETLNFTLNPAPSVPNVTGQTYNEAARTFTLTWDESTDTDGVQEYRVYLNGQLVASLNAGLGSYSYTFENLVPGVAYTAEVRAVDTLGAISTAASATFGGEQPSTPNTGAFDLSGNNGARAILIAILGVGIAVAIIAGVTRHNARSRR